MPDGRTIAYTEVGDPAGDPVFYLHGGPGSRLEAALFHDAASRHGLRLIAIDRPGMGQSTYLGDRTLLDCPRDLSDLADALGLRRFGVIGWSGGGAHATVCAYALSERLTCCLSLAGYTNWAELPDAARMLRFAADRMAVTLAGWWPPLVRTFFWMMKHSARRMPNALIRSLRSTACPADRAILADPEFVDVLIRDQREAFRQGSRGPTTDALVHYRDWGYRLAETRNRVHVFHGTDDTQVPIAYGRHLAANLPNVVLHELAGEGHLFPVTHQDLIFATARSEL
ncbi:alpha/beta fold hydrolase [Mycobacterium spongiae]|uniref:Alpha/beta fold hydrolase n=1 Tax=Mycobacterium spongiae TaxID=886343 RepID=A0A975K1L0_9MYCO|nr:alpha/beta fold hydrolase [Mycobacterium spongiae]